MIHICISAGMPQPGGGPAPAPYPPQPGAYPTSQPYPQQGYPAQQGYPPQQPYPAQQGYPPQGTSRHSLNSMCEYIAHYNFSKCTVHHNMIV